MLMLIIHWPFTAHFLFLFFFPDNTFALISMNAPCFIFVHVSSFAVLSPPPPYLIRLVDQNLNLNQDFIVSIYSSIRSGWKKSNGPILIKELKVQIQVWDVKSEKSRFQ